MAIKKYTKEIIDAAPEIHYLKGLMCSTNYCNKILNRFKIDYITNNVIRTVSKWFLDRFDKVQIAPPNIDIVRVILSNGLKIIPESKVALVESLIDHLDIELLFKSPFNWKYVVILTTEYFQKREAEITLNTLTDLFSRGDIDAFQQEVQDYGKIPGGVAEIEWTNPFSDTAMKSYKKGDDDPNIIFTMQPPAIGKYLGPMKRGWLIAFIGAYKTGKSFNLSEIAVQALQDNSNITYFSIEMNEAEVQQRMVERITQPMPIGKGSGKQYILPVFDCVRNQEGSCTKPERTCRCSLALYTNITLEDKVSYAPPRYSSCVACRNTQNSTYQVTTFGKWVEAPTEDQERQQAEQFYDAYGDNLKLIHIPVLTLPMMETHLNRLEQAGHITDLLIIDYADIITASQKRSQSWNEDDDIWKDLFKLANERNLLLITATQGNRASKDSANVKSSHTAGSIGKMRHVTAAVTLSKTEEDEVNCLLRMNLSVHRHRGRELKQLIVLQQLGLGQSLLDAY